MFNLPAPMPESATQGALSVEERKKQMMIKMLQQGVGPGQLSKQPSHFEGLTNALRSGAYGGMMGGMMNDPARQPAPPVAAPGVSPFSSIF